MRPLARKGASRQRAKNTAQPCRCKLSGQPGRPMGPEIEGISFVAPNYGPVVQFVIKPCARAQCHRISSCQSCGSFGRRVRTTAPTHLGMPLHRCQTVGSPVAPPEALQPKTHSPLRRAPGLHSCLGCSGRIGGWPMRCGRRCARGALAGYSSGTPGGTPAESGHRRRRWCAPAIGVPISHRGYALKVLTRMP